MSDAPRVSVVIPAYNEEAHILRSVRSITRQDHDDLEVIVVDDGSSDRTVERALSDADPRVRVIPNTSEKGVVGAMNTGFLAARGEFVARMDADDMSLPGRIGRQVAAMLADRECVACGCGHYFLNYRDRDFRRIVPVTSDAALRREMLTHNPVNTGAAMYRRSALLKVGGFTTGEKKAEGYSLLIKLSEEGRLANVAGAEYVYFLRQGEGNRSTEGRFRPRNTAMAAMTERMGSRTGGSFKARLAGAGWKVYHRIPRRFQIMIRNLVSAEKHITLASGELSDLERRYDELGDA